MHKRKSYLIYPPTYTPGEGYEVRYSKLQALKAAKKMGIGACVDVCTQWHPVRATQWISSHQKPLWTISQNAGK
jgi:hypothetical protein